MDRGMFMKICILEDMEKDAKVLIEGLRQYEKENQTHLEIDYFRNSEKLSDILNDHYDLVFLDIYLDKENGIDIARKIREYQDVNIVFLTSSNEFALDAFEVRALHYILKPINGKQIQEVMRRYKRQQKIEDTKQVTIKVGHSEVILQESHISYIEKEGKVALIHTKQGLLRSYSTLEVLYEQLSHALFTRPQRSYIVNYNFIQEVKTSVLVLKNQLEISMNRKIRSKLKNDYYDYLFNDVRGDTKYGN